MIRMIVGPPCAGKSSFLDMNVPPGTPRFDLDKIYTTVAGTDGARTDTQPGVLEVVLSMRRGLMGWLLDPETQPGEVWVVNANPSESTVSRWIAAGGVFHVLDPGEAECLARAQREGRPPEVVDAIAAWYKSPPVIPEEYIQKGGDPMKIKSMPVSVKADSDDSTENGTFTAYASVFGNKDSYGDVVKSGAFADTLKEWEASGNVLPVLYGHDFADPFSNIGSVVKAEEDDHGLKITGKLDLDNPKAAQVYKLLKEKRLSQMSFAFDVLKGAWVDDEEEGDYYSIDKVKLYEVSVVPIGANQETEILAVKAGTHNTPARPKDGTPDFVNANRIAILKMELALALEEGTHES